MIDVQRPEAFALARDTQDAAAFTDWASRVIGGVLCTIAPPELHVVKIDSWFGQKWLGFSYTVLHELAVFNRRDLRVPPFVPNRVVAQHNFVRELSGGYYAYRQAAPLHLRQHSADNARRLVSTLYPSAALFWWSGATERNRRGSLMAYLPSATGHTAWYAERACSARRGWHTSLAAGISPESLDAHGFSVIDPAHDGGEGRRR